MKASADRDGAIEHVLRTLIARMKEITHLNAVLRKKNRKIARLRQVLDAQDLDLNRLCAALEEITHVSTRAEARAIAAGVLQYDYQRRHRRQNMTAELDDAPNEVKDQSDQTKEQTTEDVGNTDPEQEHAAPHPEGD